MKITNKNVTPEIARIHAHLCGDGHCYLSKEHRSPGTLKKHPRRNLDYFMWVIGYTNLEKELIKEFQDDMRVAFNRKGFYNKYNFEIRFRGAKHLIEKLHMENSSYGRWVVPHFITNASEKIICDWLKAFFDDEGSVTKSNVIVYNTNREGMIQVLDLLNRIGIKTKLRKRKNAKYKDCYSILIPSVFVPIYYKKIGFTHPKKRTKLKKNMMGRVGFEPTTPSP